LVVDDGENGALGWNIEGPGAQPRGEAFDPRPWRAERRFWAGEAILEDIVQ
jgi:hypothetical protein